MFKSGGHNAILLKNVIPIQESHARVILITLERRKVEGKNKTMEVKYRRIDKHQNFI